MHAHKPDRGLAALLALALAALACNALGESGGATDTPPGLKSPTPKSAATEGAEPTATPPPRPTKTPQATRPPLPTPTTAAGPGDVVYFNDFDDLNEWTTVFAIPQTDDYTAEIRGSTLYIQVDAHDTTVYAFHDFDLGRPDVQVDADVETVAGPNRNNISLVCRASGDGWYEFSMNSGGFWFIWRYDPKGLSGAKGIEDIASGASTAINLKKAKNHLTAVCQGDTLTFYINDVEVGSVSDDTFAAGQFGVSVTTFDITGAGVEFDWVAVSIP